MLQKVKVGSELPHISLPPDLQHTFVAFSAMWQSRGWLKNWGLFYQRKLQRISEIRNGIQDPCPGQINKERRESKSMNKDIKFQGERWGKSVKKQRHRMKVENRMQGII